MSTPYGSGFSMVFGNDFMQDYRIMPPAYGCGIYDKCINNLGDWKQWKTYHSYVQATIRK